MNRPRFIGLCPRNKERRMHWPDLRALMRGEELSSLFAAPGCHVLHSAQGSHRDQNMTTLVLGRVSHAAPGYPCATDGAASHMPALIDEKDFWGDFVAISNSEGATILYRSAQGRLPCYVCETDDWIGFSSDIDLLARALSRPFEPDWNAIAHHLSHPHQRVPQTCLAGVTEIFGGQSLTISRDLVTRNEWTPWKNVTGKKHRIGLDEARHQLRGAALQTVKRLAQPYRHVVLGISGGLDSSIVAAALANAGAPITLVTLASRDPRGDERHYARILANHLGAELVERFEDINLIDPFHSQSAHLPRPIGRAFAQSADALLSDEARIHGADCHFTGAGGDNVFCYLQSAAPVADQLKRGRLLEGLRCASDIGKVTDAGMLKAFRLGVRRAFRPSAYRWPLDRRFLTADALYKAQTVEPHPWLAAPRASLPGTAAHIAAIAAIENHLEGFHRELALPVISPLVSRPMVDAALVIPPRLWCAGGRNRAVARHAFADLLPPEIIARQTKGTPDGVAAALYERDRAQIRDFLCDGALADQAIIDRDAIIDAMKNEGPVRGDDYIRILALCDVEAWLQTRFRKDRPARLSPPEDDARQGRCVRAGTAPLHP